MDTIHPETGHDRGRRARARQVRPARRRGRLWATRAERAASRPGDALVSPSLRVPLMATTIAMPPDELWSYLIQMGSDRAGFYSWDRLDNAGHPSAQRVHPEWQDLALGGQIIAAPDGSVAFDVAGLDPQRTLVLRLSIRLPSAQPFDPRRSRPRAFVDCTWGLYLSPGPGGTRLVSSVRITGRPRWLLLPMIALVARPAHSIMQARQFAELRRRAAT